MELDAITQDGEDVVVRILVVPNASANTLVGLHGDRIRVRVAAPPERGRANDAVCALLGAATGAKNVVVEAGSTHRKKTVRLSAMSRTDVMRSLSVES
jgi:uncharacterized protein (TIGR00251 family)